MPHWPLSSFNCWMAGRSASSLRVLTVDDLGFDSKGGGLFMTYLQTKEQLAQPRASLSFTPLGITGIP